MNAAAPGPHVTIRLESLAGRYSAFTTSTPPPAPVPSYDQPAAGAKTNVFAIVAIITVWFGAIFGLIYGYVALSQIKRTGEGGRGLALASVIIAWIAIDVGIIGSVIAFIVLGIAASNGQIRTTCRSVPDAAARHEWLPLGTMPRGACRATAASQAPCGGCTSRSTRSRR